MPGDGFELLLDREITLTRAARIYVNSVVEATADADGTELVLAAKLRTGDGATVVAETHLGAATIVTAGYTFQVTTSGVLATRASPTPQPVTFQPGTYRLQLTVDGSGLLLDDDRGERWLDDVHPARDLIAGRFGGPFFAKPLG